MCWVLRVNPSGYYAWLAKPVSARTKETEQLTLRIQQFFQDSDKTYGSPRIYKDLREAGYVVGENRVARIMRLNKICVQRAYKKPRFRAASQPSRLFANILNRQFTVMAPNKIWATDTTYVGTLEGWLFLTVVVDLYSRMVVGWAMRRDNHRHGPMDAAFMAVKRRQPTSPVLIHSDQGSQFSSFDFQSVLLDHQIDISMDGRGRATDNIAIERFWGTLKRAEVYLSEYHTAIDAYRGISRYIKKYNSERPHTSHGDLTPDEAYLGQITLKREA